MARERPLSTIGILAISFLALIAGHALLKAYMPNVAVGGMGFLLIVLLFSYVLLVRRDVFGFILVIYICSHFSYADNQGGLWNLMAFGMLILYKLTGGRRKSFRRPDVLMYLLLGIFILWNLLGWVLKNPVPLMPRLQGIAMLFGLIIVYSMTSNLVISSDRFRKLLSITLVMLVYQFVVALNQRYPMLQWNTPLLGGYTDTGTSILPGVVDTPGTIGNFELFAEYGTLMLALLVPLLSSSATQRELRFGSNIMVVMIFICLVIPMMTSTRSAALLSIIVVVSCYIVFPLRVFSGIDRVGRQLRIILIVGVLLPVVGVYVGMRHLQEDMSDLSVNKITTTSIVSGASINRGGLTSMAMKRIEADPWWVGYGLGVPRSNQWAWFGVDASRSDVRIADYHSLYLSLPMLYGWVGSLAYLAMILFTLFRVSSAALRYRSRKSFLVVVSVGLTLFWFVFLADQYKISVIRNPGYHMLFWIWLGLTHASMKTLRYGAYTPRSTATQKDENRRRIA